MSANYDFDSGVDKVSIITKDFSYKLEIDNHRLVFSYSIDGVSWETPLISNKYLDESNELHIAISRKESTVYMFFDGIRDDNTLNIATDTIFSNAADLVVGGGYFGRMDEMRVSIELRWLTDFVIPTIPYSQAGYYTYQIDDIANWFVGTINVST